MDLIVIPFLRKFRAARPILYLAIQVVLSIIFFAINTIVDSGMLELNDFGVQLVQGISFVLATLTTVNTPDTPAQPSPGLRAV